MIVRMNDCVPLGSTGYPLAFAMNVVAGRKTYRTGSAFHLLRMSSVAGSGGVRSSAVQTGKLALYAVNRMTLTTH